MPFRESVSVRLSDGMRARLEIISAQAGLRLTDLIRRAVEEYLQRIAAEKAITLPINVDITGDKNVVAITGPSGLKAAESRATYNARKGRQP